LENVADAAIAVDLEGKIIYWNKAAEALYKFKAAEAMGRTIASLNISTPNPDSSLTDLAESQPLDGEM
jgi:PAS domain S-box-containing protein